MRIEKKITTVHYKVFEIGEKVVGTAGLFAKPRTVYTVREYHKPVLPEEIAATVFLEEMGFSLETLFLTSAKKAS